MKQYGDYVIVGEPMSNEEIGEALSVLREQMVNSMEAAKEDLEEYSVEYTFKQVWRNQDGSITNDRPSATAYPCAQIGWKATSKEKVN